ncbi:MFS transporter [Cytophagaceae bacterium DM2B3-1]|uniref:MFS transporter n=1 Tax=Xanthocytophaga flava TaxID=3048013 RepID=A0ABT7CI14_9BACT|nr:MFS transporter [Xanthocytophaga flavus]MDJ1493343.1 MFS transporter [Xanthocytophaga flavus]
MQSSRFWQTTTAVGLFIGYSGYYLCRSNLAVATPLIIQEFGDQGIDKEMMGKIASAGVIAYAVGKVINGLVGDAIGGKRVFLLGMIASVLATILFGLGGGVLVFFVAVVLNRAVQSMGWGGLVKITAHWFSYRNYGKVMGLLSLSYLFGDIVAKLWLGQLIRWGLTWQELFFVAGGTLFLIALFCLWAVKNDPESMGFDAPEINPNSLLKEDSNEQKASLGEILRTYFSSLSFILLLIMSFGLTAIREAFNFWLPTYLFEVADLSEGAASQFSSLYPVFGMVSILAAGFLSDSALRGKRSILILLGCVPMTFVLILMAADLKGQIIPLILSSLIGLLLLGPYSFLAGAMSMDLGGRKGSATAVGLVDGVGYLGGTLSVWLTGRLAQYNGWNSAFWVLAVITALTAIAAGIFYWTQERQKEEMQVY